MKKPILIIVAVLVGIFVAVLGVDFVRGFGRGFADAARHGGSPTARERRLGEISNQLNKGLPKKIDPKTELITTTAGPGLRFTYVYRLINLTRADVDVVKLTSAVKPR